MPKNFLDAQKPLAAAQERPEFQYSTGFLGNLGFIVNRPAKMVQDFLVGKPERALRNLGQFFAELATLGAAPNNLLIDEADDQQWGILADIFLDPLTYIGLPTNAVAKVGMKSAGLLKSALRVGSAGLKRVPGANKALKQAVQSTAFALVKHRTPALAKNISRVTGTAIKGDDTVAMAKAVAEELQKNLDEFIKTEGASLGQKSVEKALEQTAETFKKPGVLLDTPGILTGGSTVGLDQIASVLPLDLFGLVPKLTGGKSLRGALGWLITPRQFGKHVPLLGKGLPVGLASGPAKALLGKGGEIAEKLPAGALPGAMMKGLSKYIDTLTTATRGATPLSGRIGIHDFTMALPPFLLLKAIRQGPVGKAMARAFTKGSDLSPASEAAQQAYFIDLADAYESSQRELVQILTKSDGAQMTVEELGKHMETFDAKVAERIKALLDDQQIHDFLKNVPDTLPGPHSTPFDNVHTPLESLGGKTVHELAVEQVFAAWADKDSADIIKRIHRALADTGSPYALSDEGRVIAAAINDAIDVTKNPQARINGRWVAEEVVKLEKATGVKLDRARRSTRLRHPEDVERVLSGQVAELTVRPEENYVDGLEGYLRERLKMVAREHRVPLEAMDDIAHIPLLEPNDAVAVLKSAIEKKQLAAINKLHETALKTVGEDVARNIENWRYGTIENIFETPPERIGGAVEDALLREDILKGDEDVVRHFTERIARALEESVEHAMPLGGKKLATRVTQLASEMRKAKTVDELVELATRIQNELPDELLGQHLKGLLQPESRFRKGVSRRGAHPDAVPPEQFGPGTPRPPRERHVVRVGQAVGRELSAEEADVVREVMFRATERTADATKKAYDLIAKQGTDLAIALTDELVRRGRFANNAHEELVKIAKRKRELTKQRRALKKQQKAITEQVDEIGLKEGMTVPEKTLRKHKELVAQNTELNSRIAVLVEESSRLSARATTLRGSLSEHLNAFEVPLQDAKFAETVPGRMKTLTEDHGMATRALDRTQDVRPLLDDLAESARRIVDDLDEDTRAALEGPLKNIAADIPPQQRLDELRRLLKKLEHRPLKLSPVEGGSNPRFRTVKDIEKRIGRELTENELRRTKEILFAATEETPKAVKSAYENLKGVYALDNDLGRALLDELVSRGKFYNDKHRQAWQLVARRRQVATRYRAATKLDNEIAARLKEIEKKNGIKNIKQAQAKNIPELAEYEDLLRTRNGVTARQSVLSHELSLLKEDLARAEQFSLSFLPTRLSRLDPEDIPSLTKFAQTVLGRVQSLTEDLEMIARATAPSEGVFASVGFVKPVIDDVAREARAIVEQLDARAELGGHLKRIDGWSERLEEYERRSSKGTSLKERIEGREELTQGLLNEVHELVNKLAKRRGPGTPIEPERVEDFFGDMFAADDVLAAVERDHRESFLFLTDRMSRLGKKAREAYGERIAGILDEIKASGSSPGNLSRLEDAINEARLLDPVDLPLDRVLEGFIKTEMGRARGAKRGLVQRALEAFAREWMGLPSLAKQASLAYAKGDPSKAIKMWTENPLVGALVNSSRLKQYGFKTLATVGMGPIIFPGFHIMNSLSMPSQALMHRMGNLDQGAAAALTALSSALDGTLAMIPKTVEALTSKIPGLRSLGKMVGVLGEARPFTRLLPGNKMARLAWANAFDKTDELKKLKVDLEITSADYAKNVRTAIETDADLAKALSVEGDTVHIKNGLGFVHAASAHGVVEAFTRAELFVSQLGKQKSLAVGVGESVESGARMGMWMNFIRNGMGPSEAGVLVREILYDYSKLSDADRTIRAVFPFGKFMMEAIPSALRATKQRPGVTNALLRAAGPKTGDGLEVEVTIDGKTVSVGVPSVLESLSFLGSREGMRRTMERNLASASPVLTAPLQILSGRSFFSGNDLKVWDMMRMVPGSRLMTTLNTASGQQLRALVDQTMLLKQRDLLERWVPVLTGQYLQEVDPDRQMLEDIRNYLQHLLENPTNENVRKYQSFVAGPEAPPEVVAIIKKYNKLRTKTSAKRRRERAAREKLLGNK